jgi:hypothetical protein
MWAYKVDSKLILLSQLVQRQCLEALTNKWMLRNEKAKNAK